MRNSMVRLLAAFLIAWGGLAPSFAAGPSSPVSQLTIPVGPSSGRPAPKAGTVAPYFDTTLGKLILGNGTGFTDAAGSAIAAYTPTLRGVNLSGAESIGNANAFPAQAAIDYFVAKGATVVRIPFSMERLIPVPSGPVYATYANYLDSIVNYALSKGLYVILDPHNFMRFQVGATITDDNPISGGTTAIIGQDPAYTNQNFADFHTAVVTRYNHPRIIYGLNNEPHDQDDAKLLASNNAAIAAIRAAGRSNFILVNGNDYGTAAWGVGKPNRTYMPQIVDPLNYWGVDQHHYLDAGAAGVTATIDPNYMDALTSYTTFARSAGLRTFLGEIGGGAPVDNLKGLSDVLAHVAANSDVYLGFTAWTAVKYQDSAILQLLPTELTTIGPSAALPSSVTDRAQTKVIAPFWNATPLAPAVVAPAAISGTAAVGGTLKVQAAFSGYPAPSLTYQVTRGGSQVAATQNYGPVGADQGATLTMSITATNASGSVTTSATVAVASAPVSVTWDPSAKKASILLSNNNLTAGINVSPNDDPDANWPLVRSTGAGHSTGKYYWQFSPNNSNGLLSAGLIPSTYNITATDTKRLSNLPYSVSINADGSIYGDNNSELGYWNSATWAAGNFIGVAVDIDNRLVWIRNGSGLWNNNASANPATGVGGITFHGTAGLVYHLAASPYYYNVTLNSGGSAYAAAAPSGFSNW